MRSGLSEATNLGFGLHLNLTVGQPVSPPVSIPNLIRADGHFRGKVDVIANLSSLNLEEAECELRAQIERFIAVAGCPPDHLDSHHHITYLSLPMFSVMLRLAADFDVPIRSPILADPESGTATLLQWGVAKDAHSVREMIATLRIELEQSGVRAPDYFVPEFFDETGTLGHLLLILTSLSEGTSELMCHPGIVDKALRASFGYVERREAEFEALTHPSAREVVEAGGIRLIRFEDLCS